MKAGIPLDAGTLTRWHDAALHGATVPPDSRIDIEGERLAQAPNALDMLRLEHQQLQVLLHRFEKTDGEAEQRELCGPTGYDTTSTRRSTRSFRRSAATTSTSTKAGSRAARSARNGSTRSAKRPIATARRSRRARSTYPRLGRGARRAAGDEPR
jgi:hypothetical protein